MQLSTLFTLTGQEHALLLHGHHDHALMLLSVFVAILSSGFALQLAGLIRGAETATTRRVAVLSGSLVLGGGIWAMHFIGMLALQLGTAVSYDATITLLSVLPALPASWLALKVLGEGRHTIGVIAPAGMLIGVGIAAMHYAGMFAIRIEGDIRLDPLWFAASFVVALSMPVLALWLHFRLQRQRGLGPLAALVLGGIMMGLAIAAMHYTGMAAAQFVSNPVPQPQPAGDSATILSLSIALGVVLLGVIVAVTNGFLRYHFLMRKAQNNENRVRAILDTAVDGIITINSRGLIQSFNRAAETLFGWSAADVLGRNVNMLMPSPYQEQHDQYLRHYSGGGEARIIGTGREVTALHRDGRTFPIRLGVGETRVDGQPMFVGFVTDISLRKAMEQSLRDSEQQYSSLIANIPGTSFRCLADASWPMLFISDAVLELTGWPPETFLNRAKAFSDIIHPDDRERVWLHVQASLEQGRSYDMQYRIVRRDGSERWVSERGSASFTEDGKPKWIDGVILDTTEARLRAAEFEGTVEAIGRAQAVIEFDLQGRVLSMNDNARQLCRWERLPTGLSWQALFVSQEGLDERFWEGLQAGRYQSGELQLNDLRGDERWIQAYFNPILDAEGRPVKVVLLAADLSERRQMVKALELARDKAEQAAAAKSAFLANMSHEIRTPMNAILGFTEMLLDSPLSEQQYQHLRTVDRSARSLLRLLNDILDTAKLERGAIELESQDYSLATLCREVLDVLDLQAQAKGLKLTLRYAVTREWFRGDALRVQQILMNLLSNAVKFTDQGAVTLEVEESAEGVVLRISDTGIGIEADRLEQIFAAFSQADASMSRRFGGTGLGTTIARQLTQLMNGRLDVSSEVGVGSVFQVTLPLLPGKPQPVATAVRGRQLPALRVLAADDVEENLELLQVLLKRGGHSVELAHNGQEALEIFQRERFDLVLMDVQMPVLDGHAATRRIRAFEQRQGRVRTPIIALTASVLYQDRTQAREAGMDGFASKPLEWALLVQEIARVLQLDALPLAPGATPAAGLHTIHWEAALARWGDREALLMSIRRFLQTAGAGLEELRGELGREGQPDVKSLSHRLKGAAANLGLEAMAAAVGELEEAAQAPAAEAALGEALASALQALHQLREALQAEDPRDSRQSPSSGPPARMAAPETLAACVRALRNGELPNELLQAILAQLDENSAQALRAALDDFNFEDAIALLLALSPEDSQGVGDATAV